MKNAATTNLTFASAHAQLTPDVVIRRAGWKARSVGVTLGVAPGGHQPLVIVIRFNGQYEGASWNPCNADFCAEDWEVVALPEELVNSRAKATATQSLN